MESEDNVGDEEVARFDERSRDEDDCCREGIKEECR